MKSNKPWMVLLSGGADSALVLQMSPTGSQALFVDYGQAAVGFEKRAAQTIAKLLSRHLHRTSVLLNGLPFKGDDGPCVIPARNLVLLSLAANVARSVGITQVAIGCNKDDANTYEDCRPEFLTAAAQTLLSDGEIVLRAPVSGLSKKEVTEKLEPWILSATRSCYFPGEFGVCGKCFSCRERAAAREGV